MVDQEDKDYVCTLDEKTLEKAKKELSEDPKQRLGAVKTLRAWIKSQSHLTCRTDTDYLLQVLRTAKFSQLKAREIIEEFLTIKSKSPQYATNIDTHEPIIVKYIDKGALYPLPRTDKEGRTVLISRLGLGNPKDGTMIEDLRTMMAIIELLKEKNENAVVNGFIIIYDMSEYTLAHATRTTIDTVKVGSKLYQDTGMGRMKGFHFYNAGQAFDVIFAVAKPFLKKKLLDRIVMHNSMETLYKVIPMELWPDEYLPDDYKGPSAGPAKALSANVKKRLMEPGFRKRLLEYTSDKYGVNMSKKDISVPQASFRKLNID